MKKTNSMGVGVALGLCFGVAMGAALHKVGLGIAIGLPIGIAMGAAMNGQKRDGGDKED